MSSGGPTDADLRTVARVAGREGWADDLENPPDRHPPRTLDEERAVAGFARAVAPAAAGPAPRPPRASARRAPGPGHERRVRIALVVLAVVVLAACWVVSPERTALGLLGAGLVCLVALRRRRRARDRDRGIAGPGPWARRVARPW